MKYILTLVLMIAFAIGLFAHPASNVTLSYDTKTQYLSVGFEHSVKNPADHFISGIVIKVGGKEVISQSLNVQEKAVGGSLVYKLLDLKPGTVVEAITECNKVGKKSAKLTIK